MSIYVYWGEDEFARDRAVLALKEKALAPDWASFNFNRILADQPDGALTALTQAMTPPFGCGQRFVWLVDPPFLSSVPRQ